MSEFNDVLALVRVSANKKRLFLPHALRQKTIQMTQEDIVA